MLSNRDLSISIVVTALLLSADAFADDYTVSYVFDGAARAGIVADAASSLREEGSTRECEYERPCKIELTKSDLTITLNALRSGRHKVVVFADGGRSRSIDCCFFGGGERRAESELAQPSFWLRIYEGHARKRNEYVQNIHLGLLHLQFSDLK